MRMRYATFQQVKAASGLCVALNYRTLEYIVQTLTLLAPSCEGGSLGDISFAKDEAGMVESLLR